jgi:hypothetical protein
VYYDESTVTILDHVQSEHKSETVFLTDFH